MKIKIDFVFPVQQNMIRRYPTIVSTKRKVRGTDVTGRKWSFYLKGSKADLFCDNCKTKDMETNCGRIHAADLIEIPNEKIRVLMKYNNFFILTRSCRETDIIRLGEETGGNESGNN